MIPYIELPIIRILGEPIHPFTWLIGLGLVLSFVLAQRRVRKVGLYPPVNAAAMLWIAFGGFTGAHLLEMLAYQPQRVLQDPTVLLRLWEGMASFGGFLGGTLAFYLYSRRYRVWMLQYLDAQMFGYVPGWILARAGCVSAHDHPGIHSDFFLAVAYPDGPRHDLGLYEMLLAVGITLVLYLLPERKRFVGFHTALVLLLYAPVRFAFEFLRVGDRRYWGLTPAQYLCVVFVLLGLWLISRREQNREEQLLPPEEPAG